MKKLVEKSVEGASVLELCLEGDKLLEEGTGAVYNKAVKGVKVPKGASQKSVLIASQAHANWKSSLGISFPTCISVNNCVAHFSPLACVNSVPSSDDLIDIERGRIASFVARILHHH